MFSFPLFPFTPYHTPSHSHTYTHMVRSVVIARVHDGLPLSASLDEDEVLLVEPSLLHSNVIFVSLSFLRQLLNLREIT